MLHHEIESILKMAEVATTQINQSKEYGPSNLIYNEDIIMMSRRGFF